MRVRFSVNYFRDSFSGIRRPTHTETVLLHVYDVNDTVDSSLVCYFTPNSPLIITGLT